MGNNIVATYSGKLVNVLDPAPEDISIEDIAHSLSQTNRFNGHTSFPYSVAQHSVMVSRVVAKEIPRLALLGLLHDAAEAYTGDIISPIKTDGQKAIEKTMLAVIHSQCLKKWSFINYHYHDHMLIERIDKLMALTEAEQLMPNGNIEEWESYKNGMRPYTDVSIDPWNHAVAKIHFLDQYYLIAGLYLEEKSI